MKTLKPITDKQSYSKPIEKAIYSYLYELIFKPIFDILDISPHRENASTNILLDYLRKGKLTYEGTIFKGNLNASISKQLRAIGAKYDKRKKSYTIAIEKIPIDVKLAIVEGNQKRNDQLKKVEQFLKAVEGRELDFKNIKPFFSDTLGKLDIQYDETTKSVRRGVESIPLREDLKERLAEAYTENLNLYIKNWHDEQILRLRKVVQKNVSEGFRAESLIERVMAEREVSYNKAKFLAKQETSLLVSKYRQARYEDAGVNKYIWSTSHDNRVRSSHKELDGKMFDFARPPIVDKNTGRRANPGADYNCRCVPIPLLSEIEIFQEQLK